MIRNDIERIVSDYYKVEVSDLYNTSKNEYPVNGARSVLMYLLYKNGVKLYEIQPLFGYEVQRTIEKRVAKVAVAVRTNTGKFAEDVRIIQEKLNEKIK